MIRYVSLYIPTAAIIGFLVHHYQVNYSYSDFKDSLLFLAAISSVVFTIMGIWIALIYPQAISKIVSPKVVETADFTEGLRDTKRLEALVGSILKSIVVLVLSLAIFIAKAILHKTGFYMENMLLIKSTALSFLMVITFTQLEAIWHVIDSNISFLNDLHSKREDRERDNDV